MADQNLRVNITAFDKTQRAFASVRSGLGKIQSSIFSVKGAVVGLGTTLALKQFAGQIDELRKSSARLGLTVNELQSLEFAAGQTGVSSQELAKGLERFSRSIGETANGVGIAKRSFEDLGISVTNSAGQIKPTRELLGEVSDRLKNVQDPAERVRIAFDLFGRSGTRLINTLKGGNSQLTELQGNFNAVTVQLTGEQAAAVEAANDGFDRLGRTFSSIGQQITATILPPLQALAEFLTVNFLKGVISTIDAAQTLANGFVSLGNAIFSPLKALGLYEDQQRVTFGEEAQANLRKIIEGYEKLDVATGKVANRQNDVSAATKEATITFTQAKQKGEMAAEAVGRSFADSFKGIVTGTKEVNDAFQNMARMIIDKLFDIYITQQLVNSVSSFFGFGGGGTAPQARANGGSVQAGQPYIVGERGKELFVPRQSGQIVPNDKLGGGQPVTVHQNINVTTGVSQTVRAEIMTLLPQIQEASKSAVLEASRRGGTFANALGK